MKNNNDEEVRMLMEFVFLESSEEEDYTTIAHVDDQITCMYHFCFYHIMKSTKVQTLGAKHASCSIAVCWAMRHRQSQ